MRDILLIIDAQNDFILQDGALPVQGAVEDMSRLIQHIKYSPPDKIVLTLDSHAQGHIATAAYWSDGNGNPPPPFTVITHDDILKGIWSPRYNTDKVTVYLKDLETKGKHHTIWPEHCVYGTSGWEVYQPLADEINNWLYSNAGELAVHLKGRDKDMEMFSAVMPEVSGDTADKENALRFLSLISDCDRLFIAGEAENFCVKETVKDITAMAPELAPKIVILRECMSAIPVPGDDIEIFWKEMRQKGVQLK